MYAFEPLWTTKKCPACGHPGRPVSAWSKDEIAAATIAYLEIIQRFGKPFELNWINETTMQVVCPCCKYLWYERPLNVPEK